MDARREAQQIEHEDRLTLGELNDLYAQEVEEPVKPVARLAVFAPMRELHERVRIPSVDIPRAHGVPSHAVREER